MAGMKQFLSLDDMVMIERQGVNYKENPPDTMEDVLIINKEAVQGSMVDEATFHNMMQVIKLVMGNKVTISWEEVQPGNGIRVVEISICLEDGLKVFKLFSTVNITWEEVELGNYVRQVKVNFKFQLELFSLEEEADIADFMEVMEEETWSTWEDPGGGDHALCKEI